MNDKKEVYDIASDWAEKVYFHIVLHLSDKEQYKLNNEEKEAFDQLSVMNWFKMFPIFGEISEEATRSCLAIMRYNYLMSM